MPTQQEIADAIGVSKRTVAEYQKRGCPKGSSPAEVLEWKRANIEPQRNAPSESADIDEARLRKINAEANILELKFKTESGELINAEDTMREYSQRCAKARARLEMLKDEVCKDMPANREELYDRVDLCVRAALLDLAAIGGDDES